MKDQSQNSPTSQFLKTEGGKIKSNAIEVPSIALPKGGGAIKGIDEKFSVNAVNGTASFSMPLPFATARGATPSLSLSYNSGSGNGIFGLGWKIEAPCNQSWKSFFDTYPDIDLKDPNLKFLNLNRDDIPDMLISNVENFN